MMKRLSFVLLIAALVLITAPARAGRIADLFEDGVFDTKWGESLAEVAKEFPTGAVIERDGLIYYEVEDNRPVFEVEREPGSTIVFHFDAIDRLEAVSVEFRAQDYTLLLKKLDTLFGKHEIPRSKNEITPEGEDLQSEWEPDNKFEMGLALVPGLTAPAQQQRTVFAIAYYGLEKPKLSKKALGLN